MRSCVAVGLVRTPLFNPYARFPLNHIAKTVLTTTTMSYGPRYLRFWSETVAVK